MKTPLLIAAMSVFVCSLPARAGEVPGGSPPGEGGRRPAGPPPFARGAAGTTSARRLLRRELEVSCYLGFYGGRRASGSTFLLDSWVPLHLLIRNNSKRTFEGDLVCRIVDRRPQNTYAVTYRTRVLLAGRGSRKHVELDVYAPLADLAAGDGVFDLVLESSTHYSLRLSPGSLGFGRERVLDAGDRLLRRELVLVLGPRFPVLPPLACGEKRTRQLVCVQAEAASLPRRWIGYAGVRALVWDGADISRLDEFLRRTLRDYVTAGGHLIVCAGGNRPLLMRDGFLMEMLPCGLGNNERLALGRAMGWAGGSLPPAVVTRLRPGEGTRVLARGPGGIPLAVRRDLGAGAVTVLAFSLGEPFCRRRLVRVSGKPAAAPGYAKWAAWFDGIVTGGGGFLQAQARQDIRRCAFRYLAGSATKRIPKRRHIFAFLAAYVLVLVPLTYMLFRGRRRPELAWTLTPLVSLAFFAGGYRMAFRDLARSIAITDVCVVRAAPDGRGGNLSFSLVYNPSYARVDLGFADPRQVPLYLRTDTLPGSEEDLRYAHLLEESPERGMRLRGQRIDFDTSRAFESSGLARLADGLRARLRVSPPGWEKERVLGEADNRTGIYLADLALLAGGKGVLLAPLPAEDGQELRAAPGARPEDVARVCARLCRGDRTGRLRDLLLLALDLAAGGERRAFILGLLRSPAVKWLVDGRPARGRGLTVVVVPVDSAPVAPLEFEVPSYPADEDLPGFEW